jgi:hypothetical protein
MLCKPLRGPLQREEALQVYKGSLEVVAYAQWALKWQIQYFLFFKIFI